MFWVLKKIRSASDMCYSSLDRGGYPYVVFSDFFPQKNVLHFL